MTYNDFQKFLEEFTKIKSFNRKINYTNQNLTRIGSGSGRIVYDIDGTKVFKLAKNTKGVAQNEAEANAGRYQDTHDIVAIVYDFADDNSWIISEKAKKTTEKRIKELTGIPNLNILSQYLKNYKSNYMGKRESFHIDDNIKEELNENEFVQTLTDFIGGYNQHVGDMGRPSTYGEVLRNGVPSIVLTDYGLNDEVFDTYYSPQKRKQYQMYELYNFADGNDDMLSDIGNVGNEVRNGMWALIPYGVGDGDGVINEGFITFVKNRNKYPKKEVKNIPNLIDGFHECVNNLKEILNHVSNKKQFYNNLLKLQEYLISQNAYDREPLGKEEYIINEIKSNDQNDEVISEAMNFKHARIIANNVAKTHGIDEFKYLGHGSGGVAFDIGNNKVMKITSDRSEALESLKIIGKTLNNLADIYEVFETKPQSELNIPKSYVIIMEKLKTNDQYFDRILNRLDYALENILGLNIFKIIDDYRDGDYTDKKEKIDKYLSKNPKDAKFYYGLLDIINELNKYGIESNEYLHVGNLGYKQNGNLGFFDMGFGDFLSKPSQELQQIEINEDGTSKFTTDGDVGQDGFPVYDQNDSSPSIRNDLDANSAMYNEDLEYNHVVGNATEDKYELDERILSSMAGSSTVNVKKHCRLAGKGNTSDACNQGDVKNLDIKALDESTIPYHSTYWAWISPDNQFNQIPKLKHYQFIQNKYPKIYDIDALFDKAFEDGWIRVISEYNPNRFTTELFLNGYNKKRVINVFKNMFYDSVKYGNNSIFIDYENPKGSERFSTRDSESKLKLYDFINENINSNNNMSLISYSAVVLDNNSRQRLIERFKDIIPEGWTILADHMTINLGEIDSKYEKYLGFPIRLSVNDVAMDDKVIAVGVTGFESFNTKPHITLAINKENGGKPMMSNKLINWENLKRPLLITGKVTEVDFK